MQWNLQSNASDVLGLGPRTAGRLATVGVRTVDELLAAKPISLARRLQQESISSEVLRAWQGEAQLLVSLPELPATAARLLAAVGFSRAERIGQCSPTELLAAIETAQQESAAGWLAQTALPSVTDVSRWIQIAQRQEKSRAA